jgi:hypothetical protein
MIACLLIGWVIGVFTGAELVGYLRERKERQ